MHVRCLWLKSIWGAQFTSPQLTFIDAETKLINPWVPNLFKTFHFTDDDLWGLEAYPSWPSASKEEAGLEPWLFAVQLRWFKELSSQVLKCKELLVWIVGPWEGLGHCVLELLLPPARASAHISHLSFQWVHVESLKLTLVGNWQKLQIRASPLPHHKSWLLKTTGFGMLSLLYQVLKQTFSWNVTLASQAFKTSRE